MPEKYFSRLADNANRLQSTNMQQYNVINPILVRELSIEIIEYNAFIVT